MPEQPSTVAPRTQPTGVGFYLLSGVIIIAALQGILYLYVIGSTVGPFSFLKKEKPPDPSLLREMKVALLRSEFTAALYPENPELYLAQERHWERVLRREGIPYRVISDAELAKGLRDDSVVILPGAACQSAAEKNAVGKFLQQGKGVIASGPVGTRDEHCVWQGWDFLQRLSGIGKVSAVTPTARINVAFRGQLYFSGKIPTGYRVELPPQELIVGTAAKADAFWTDWRLRPQQGSSLENNAVAVHLIAGTGRVVWFGFQPRLPAEQVIDQGRLDYYLTTSTLWAGKRPLSIVGTWPQQKQVAIIVAEDVGQDYNNALGTTSLLKQQEIPAIFVCSSDEAKKNPETVKDFESVGEVAAAGDSLQPFAGQLPVRQAERLRQAKQDLEKLTGGHVVGFGPPQAMADGSTVEALNDAGYRYYLNEMAVSQAVPDIVDFTQSAFFPLQKTEVLKIYRTTSDDFEVIAHSLAQDPQTPQGPQASQAPQAPQAPPAKSLAEVFLSEYRRHAVLGGLYPFYFHSYLLGSAEYRNVLTAVLAGLRGENVWLTSGEDLVTWWTRRNKLETKTRKISIHRIQLDVANTGQDGVKDASVYLYLPYRPNTIDIGSPISRLQKPKWTMLNTDDILRIDFSNLKSQSYYTYQVKMDE